MILPVPVRGKQKSVDLCNAFAQGAPKGAFGFVFYGVNETNMRDWLIAQKSGHDWFYIDNSYFDAVRGQQYRVTKNRFQVQPLLHESDGKRFALLGIEVKPMRDFKGYCLVVEQSPSFMADIARDADWLTARIERTFTTGAFGVRIRPWSAAKSGMARTLPADLAGAAFVLTHSSAAAIEALIAGVHVQVSEMSAVRGVDETQRLQAFNVLADNQFHLDELRSGKAWSWLNNGR